VSEKDVDEMDRRLAAPEASLDAPMPGDDDGGRSRLDFLSEDARPDQAVAQGEFAALLRGKLEAFAATLEGREQTIFRERWLTESPLTLQELGERYGVSRERARQLEKRMRISCFVANENERVALLLEHLARGARVAYVSEAGLPVWSDPGLRLVQAAVAEGYEVDVVPGPTAAAVALCLSGLPAEDVRFLGFLPRSGPERAARMTELARETATVLVYEAGNRTPALLRDLAVALPDAATRGSRWGAS
jgi:hypothetical protein